MLPEPLAWQALHKAAHLKGAGHWPGTAAPTQLWFSDSARSCQQNPAPQTPFPSPSSFPCASCWSCPPTRKWGTNTSPVCLKAQLFPSLTQRVCGCQRGSGPTSLHVECGRTKLCRHHWKKIIKKSYLAITKVITYMQILLSFVVWAHSEITKTCPAIKSRSKPKTNSKFSKFRRI